MTSAFKIAGSVMRNPVVLAPMAGVSDLPFRQLAYRLGAGMVVAEMLTADKRLWNSRKSKLRLELGEDISPRVVQIAGAEPAMLADAARRVADLGAQMVDINMGCPAKKVCNRAAGSALMRDEALVTKILQAVVAASPVPVTLKMRTGWSPEEQNAVAIARIAESSGVQAVTVHGRSRACRFLGPVDYSAIAAVKAAVRIPVIANGDIDSGPKAAQILAKTGADAVMVGRAALGKPWLPGHIAYFLHNGVQLPDPGVQDVRKYCLEHLATLHAFYGEFMGTRVARKHVGWYLHEYDDSDAFRREFNQLDSARKQQEKLHHYFDSLDLKQEGIAA